MLNHQYGNSSLQRWFSFSHLAVFLESPVTSHMRFTQLFPSSSIKVFARVRSNSLVPRFFLAFFIFYLIFLKFGSIIRFMKIYERGLFHDFSRKITVFRGALSRSISSCLLCCSYLVSHPDNPSDDDIDFYNFMIDEVLDEYDYEQLYYYPTW